MKNFYTKEELKNISDDELLELTTFGRGDNIYYYSNLADVSFEEYSSEKEYSFKLKDGSSIYTRDYNIYNSVITGKARFDLLTKSLEDNKSDEDKMNKFLENITSMVSDRVTNMEQRNDKSKDIIEDNIKNMTKNATNNIEKFVDMGTKIVSGLSSNNQSVIDLMTSKIEEVSTKWDGKVDELKMFDIEAYNIKMKKVEAIIKAFDKLLED